MPGLNATIGADASAFENELRLVEARTKAWAKRMEANVSGVSSGGGAGKTGARAYGGASSAMFVSVARDTAASLASGANPITVFMQQAPQVLQAFTMMGLAAKTLIGLFSGVGAALLVAFATNYISKGIASMVNGLDAIAARGERLESFRKLMHRLVDEMREAAKVKVELYADEFAGKESESTAKAKKRAAELAAYKAELEKKNIEGMKLGNADNSEADKISVLLRQKENLQKDLEDAQAQGESPQTRKLQKELDDLKAIPINNKTEADYARILSLQDQIGYSSRADDETKKAAILAAQTAIQQNQNEIDRAGLPAKPEDAPTSGESSRASGGRSVAMLTDWERAGASRGGNMLFLDVSKAQLTELRTIKDILRGNGGRGVQF